MRAHFRPISLHEGLRTVKKVTAKDLPKALSSLMRTNPLCIHTLTNFSPLAPSACANSFSRYPGKLRRVHAAPMDIKMIAQSTG